MKHLRHEGPKPGTDFKFSKQVRQLFTESMNGVLLFHSIKIKPKQYMWMTIGFCHCLLFRTGIYRAVNQK